jgi:4-amino-4-deoxy-L-arabinose transferase-like glycosyltransferase
MSQLENHPSKKLETLGLLLVLALALWLRCWDLQANAWGNAYYAAAIRSMLGSWHNFFYASFDPSGFVSVDKPPVALWIQAASAAVFGYHPLSLILPQVAEGLASVALLWWLVRRHFGALAALAAALLLAVTPVAVAVDRFNNVDSCLGLLLLSTAWALSVAVESGRRGPLLLAAALAGLAFNTKMLAAFVALPAFAAVYLAATPGGWTRRLANAGLAGLVLAAVSLAWVAAVDLSPADQRPYVGSTKNNSMLELTLGWNGLQRMTQRGRGLGRPLGLSPTAETAATTRASGFAPGQGWGRRGGRGPRGGRGGFMGSGQPGAERLFDGRMAGQVEWFFPLALLGLLAAWGRARPGGRRRTQLALWAGWYLLYALVFSFMQGAMHTYYLVLLGPPLAALAGIGVEALWEEHRDAGRLGQILATGLALTAFWQWHLMENQPDWAVPLGGLMAGGLGLGLLCLALPGDLWPRARPRLAPLGLLLGMGSLLLAPTFWALTPLLARNGASVDADPSLLDQAGARGPGGLPGSRRLLDYIQPLENGATYALAAESVRPLETLIIQHGLPVMAWGGFNGGDPILTVDRLSDLAASGRLRFALLQEGGVGQSLTFSAQGLSGTAAADFARRQALPAWVREHGRLVDPSLWRAPNPVPLSATSQAPDSAGPWMRDGRWQLYDLKGGATDGPRIAHTRRRFRRHPQG